MAQNGVQVLVPNGHIYFDGKQVLWQVGLLKADRKHEIKPMAEMDE